MPASPTEPSDDAYPGEALGLPESGPGSLATWGARIGALLIDWGASMIVAIGAFGQAVMTGSGWRSWMILAVFFVQKAILTALVGSSFGQLVTRIGVTRLDGRPVGWAASVARAAMVCVVFPAIAVGPHRRALDDLLLATVVVNRR